MHQQSNLSGPPNLQVLRRWVEVTTGSDLFMRPKLDISSNISKDAK